MDIRPALDPHSEIPLYKQVSEYMRGMIASGRMPAGTRLPATRELAGLLGLNRTTVSAAYAILESDGLISGHVGRGSFVTGAGASGGRGIDWQRLLDRPAVSTISTGQAAISFASSRPAERLFPVQAFRASCEEVLAGPEIVHILQLGSPAGYEPLRRYLLEEESRRGTARAGDDLIVTSGCQQALDLLARVLVRPGDAVAVEDPVYPGLKNLLAAAGAELLPIALKEDGVDPVEAERVLLRQRPKLLVVTSNFQNPTGATIPLENRAALLGQARRSGSVIVENDTYGELRYTGAPIAAIKALDGGEDVVLLRSFSKIAFPGLRVGWALGPRPLIARLAEAKQMADLHTGQLAQAALLRFAESGRLAAHREQAIAAGKERLAAVLAACEEYLPAGTRFSRPEGGMNVWVRLPQPLDAAELLPRAQREGVEYLPGSFFAVSRHEPGALRLSFAGLEPREIREGVAILGAVFGNELERVHALRSLEPAPAVV